MRDAELKSGPDSAVWEFAKSNNLVILSKDADFRQRSVLFGAPPKIIGLLLGNCPTSAVESLLRNSADIIAEFLADPEASFLELP